MICVLHADNQWRGGHRRFYPQKYTKPQLPTHCKAQNDHNALRTRYTILKINLILSPVVLVTVIMVSGILLGDSCRSRRDAHVGLEMVVLHLLASSTSLYLL